MRRLRVALGEQLKDCSQVVTLGVRTQIGDYTEKELDLLRGADIIFYPTARFVDLFATMGKLTFPTVNCYRLRGERLKQVTLFRMLKVPYPRTRVYYGGKQKRQIVEDFTFPLIAKKTSGSEAGRDVFLIENSDQLARYNKKFNPAYIQEYVQAEMELRVVVINYQKVFGAYRTVAGGGFGSNSDHGAAWQTKYMPSDALALGRNIARQGGLSDVTVEMVFNGSQFQVTELSFQYDQGGPLHPGQERFETILEMIERGEL